MVFAKTTVIENWTHPLITSSLTEIALPQRPPHLPWPTVVIDGDRRSLFVALATVDGPRDPRGRRYPLVAILAAGGVRGDRRGVHLRCGHGLGAFPGSFGVGPARIRRAGAGRDDGVSAVDPYRRRRVVAVPGSLAALVGGTGAGNRPQVEAQTRETGPAVFAALRNTSVGHHRVNGATNIAEATREANHRPHDLITAVTTGEPAVSSGRAITQ